MRKHAFLLVMLAIGLGLEVSAQVFVMDLPPGYNKVVSAESEKGLDGSPWLTETWVPGTIVMTGGKTIENLTYRYNVYRNFLYLQFRGEEYVISRLDSIDHIMMDGKLFCYDYVDPLKEDRQRLMEVAVDGKARLYINYYPLISPANYNIALGVGSKNETVSVKEAYLIKVDSVLTEVDKKGKNIPLALFDKKNEIIEFIKKEKISTKNRADIEKVVRYYNSL